MKLNMGMADRFIRLLIAALIGLLYFETIITGAWAYVLVVVACILAATAIVGICPLYTLFGINTTAGNKKVPQK